MGTHNMTIQVADDANNTLVTAAARSYGWKPGDGPAALRATLLAAVGLMLKERAKMQLDREDVAEHRAEINAQIPLTAALIDSIPITAV